MKKRQLINDFKKIGVLKNVLDFDHQLVVEDQIYNILYVPTNKNIQLTINSPTVIELSRGKVDGIRFKKTSSTIRRFRSSDHPILLCLLDEPYRILKYINENEVIDISTEDSVHHMHIIKQIETVRDILKSQS